MSTGQASNQVIQAVAGRVVKHRGLTYLARRGYHLNQFCMSLMKADNRARFKADEAGYLRDWPMTGSGKIQRHLLAETFLQAAE